MTVKADPRSRNVTFEGNTVSEYFMQYAQTIHQCLNQIDQNALEKALALLRQASLGNHRIYVAGNGGSAAIADHLCCDFTKGTQSVNGKTIRTHSFVGNMAFFSALGNDYGYEETFSTQVEMYADPGDVLILISSSGNSPNVLNAAKVASKRGVKTIGFTGFKGGVLKNNVDVNLHVDFENYGIVEDCHQMIMHVFAQFLAKLQDRS